MQLYISVVDVVAVVVDEEEDGIQISPITTAESQLNQGYSDRSSVSHHQPACELESKEDFSGVQG